MTVDEIKKALRECRSPGKCDACPLKDNNDCMTLLKWDALNAIEELEERIGIVQESMEALEKQLDDSDRINVVRCSECQYWQPPTYAEQEDGSTIGHCTAALNGQQTDAYWFCADGTR